MEDLERYQSRVPDDLFREDIEALVDEVLSYVTKSINLTSLNMRLEAWAAPDIVSLRQGLEILSLAGLGGAVPVSAETNLNCDEVLRELAQAIDRLAANFRTMDDFDLALFVDLKLNLYFNEALICAAHAGADLEGLVKLALEKVAVLSDEQLSLVWGRLRQELDSDRLPLKQDQVTILPSGFERFDSPDGVREKIAQYIVQLRPQLILANFRRGITEVSAEMIGLARILAWRSSMASETLSEQEQLLARSLARLVSILELFGREKAEVANLLRIPADCRIAKGPEFRKANAEYAKKGPSPQAIFLELRNVARIVDLLITYESPIERALRHYKLGLEVMTPEIIESFDEKGELYLQKELCKFLLERNIFAVGTKFGRSELDLLVDEATVSYVLETKLFRSGVALGPAQIKKSLVQLQSYLDQNPSSPRGILVIYNLTESLLTAPQSWIQGRYWILPINLQAEPPSGRSRSLAIEPARDDQVINIVRIEHQPKRKKRGKKTSTRPVRRNSAKRTRP